MSTVRGSMAPLRPVQDQTPTATDSWVPRFGRTERFAHWWTVAMLAAALLTGLAMGDDAESGSLLTAHVGAVVLIGFGLLVAVVVGDGRAMSRATLRLFTFDRRDAEWVLARVRHPWGGRSAHEWGMFNTGQKLLAWAVAGSVAAVVVTGIQSWSAGAEEGGPHATAVVVTVVLLSAHVFMAVVNPSTRPALHGMVFGRVRRSWAAKHHGAWLDGVDR